MTRYVHYITRMFTRTDSIPGVARDWSRALDALGHDVLLLHGTPDVEKVDVGPRTEVAYVSHVGVNRDLVPLDLGRFLRPGDVLTLHTDLRVANLVAAAAARRKGVPYLVMPHGAYYPEQLARVDRLPRQRLAIERAFVRRSLGLHLFWDSERARVASFAPGVRCIVAPTGVDRSERGWTGGGGYLSWLGRYVIDHKGLDILAEAVASMPPDRRPVIEMHGVDQGELADLRRLVADLGVTGSMHLGGIVTGDEKDHFLAASEGYLHPSRWECHSIALLENLAAGVPSLVSSGNNCAPDLAAAGAAIVADPTPTGFAEGIDQLQRSDRAKLSAGAVQFIEDRLRWEVVAQSFVDQVEAALADQPGSDPR